MLSGIVRVEFTCEFLSVRVVRVNSDDEARTEDEEWISLRFFARG